MTGVDGGMHMEKRIAIQIQHDAHWKEMLAHTADAGFRFVSMGFGSSRCFHDACWEKQIYEIGAVLSELGLSCVMTHAPYYDLRISAEHCDPAMETALLRCVEATAMLGGEIMAIHPRGYYRTGENDPADGFYCDGIEKPMESLHVNIEHLSPLVGEAIRCGCRIGVENLPVFPGWNMTFCSNDPEIHRNLIDALDPRGVCGVWDFGHAYLTHDDSAAALAAMGSRICGTHVHDNDRQSDRHWIPYTGKIDWTAEMAALSSCGYTGYLTMELVYDDLYGDDAALRAFCKKAYTHCAMLEELLVKNKI